MTKKPILTVLLALLMAGCVKPSTVPETFMEPVYAVSNWNAGLKGSNFVVITSGVTNSRFGTNLDAIEIQPIPWRWFAAFRNIIPASNSVEIDFDHPTNVLMECGFEPYIVGKSNGIWIVRFKE